jgi:hypothetical protein
MKRRILAHQEDLFDSEKPPEIRRRVRELDIEIANALKENAYDRAKALTREQEQLIQKLVGLGDQEQEEDEK